MPSVVGFAETQRPSQPEIDGGANEAKTGLINCPEACCALLLVLRLTDAKVVATVYLQSPVAFP
jgi:hypothetical protein